MTTAKPEKENGRPPIVIVGMVYAGKNGKNINDNIDIKIPSNDICNDDQLSVSRAHEESSYPTPQEKLSKNIVFSNHVRKKLSRNSSTSSFTSYNMMKDSDNLISNARMFHSPRGLPNNSIGDSLLSGG